MEGSKVSPDKNLHEEEEEVIARLIQDFNFGETSDNNNKDVTNEEHFEEWILKSTGKNVSQVLKTLKSKIPSAKAYLHPIFLAYLIYQAKTKKLFTDVEWSEMKSDFDQTVEFKEIDDKNDLCDLFDKIQEAINHEVDDIITNVEKCIIENDKVDMMVATRDVLLRDGQDINGIECNHFKKLYTLGVHSYDLYQYRIFYDVYAMDWKAKDLWRLDLIKRTKLPQSNKQLLMLEKLVITLLRVELTLNNIERIRNDLAIEAARLHRSGNGRPSIIKKQYSYCEQRVG
ncbi:4390_t:CDS:2, partial [Gigaspora margarita]